MAASGGSWKSGKFVAVKNATLSDVLASEKADSFTGAYRAIYAAPQSKQRALLEQYQRYSRERGNAAGSRNYQQAQRIAPDFASLLGR